MKSKNLVILFVVALLLGGYFFFIESDERRFEVSQRSKEVAIFEDFEKEEISKIIIAKDENESVTLKKENEEWNVVYSEDEKYPVVEAYMENLFRSLDNLEKGEVVSKNKEKYFNFELEEGKSVFVEIFDDSTPKYSFFVGKNGATYPSQYIRLNDSNEVLLISEAIKVLLDRGSEAGWRDKTVLAVDRSKLKEMSFSFKRNYRIYSYSLGMNNGSWEVVAPYKLAADQYLADRLFNAAGQLVTTDFGTKEDLNRLEELGLVPGKEMLKVKFVIASESSNENTLEETKEIELLIGNQDEEGLYYAKTSEEEMVYKVSSDIEIFTKQDLQRLKSKE